MTLADEMRTKYFQDMNMTSYLVTDSTHIFKMSLPLFKLEQDKKDSAQNYPAVKIDDNSSTFIFYSVGSFNFEINLIKELHDNRIIKSLNHYLDIYGLKAALIPEKNSELILIESKRPMPIKHWLNHILVFIQGLVSINDIFALRLEE